MTTTGKSRVLWHGTTRRRAESILLHGPNANFREPGSLFRSCRWVLNRCASGPYLFGDPRVVASGKAALFPNEGGPAILEMEVPEDLIALAINEVTEFRFEPHFGLEELLAAWPTLPKRILP